MLISIYITIVIIAFICLICSFLMAQRDDGKIGFPIFLALIALVLFSVLALSSMDLKQDLCVYKYNITGNNISFDSASCPEVQDTDQGLATLWSGMGVFSVVLIFIYVLKRT